MGDTILNYVKNSYDPVSSTPYPPFPVDPKSHTMKEQAFREYIGRADSEGLGVNCKKFTTEQSQMLQRAYDEEMNVRVLGVPEAEIDQAVCELGFEISQEGVSHYRRENKVFNCVRSAFLFAYPNFDKEQEQTELWIAVFPSRQYVDQISQMILAIFTDYETSANTPNRCTLTTWRFPEVEKKIAEWSGFSEEVRKYVRHGDVVAIGNVEFYSKGIKEAGFKDIYSDWLFFGKYNSFGVKLFVSPKSFSRILLFGVCESFWGEASGQYTNALIEAGARHVLYGSKAATVIEPQSVHGVISPKSFLNIETNRTESANPRIEHSVSFDGGRQNNDLADILKMFSIDQAELSVTVPTVIGEDQEQRNSFKSRGAACLDCENGHIAEVVDKRNRIIKSFSPFLENNVQFIPVHFLTDYIFREDENNHGDTPSLAVHANDPDYERKRDDSFLRIGRFFGHYALVHGQREQNFGNFSFGYNPSLTISSAEILDSIRPFLDYGYSREAISALLSIYRDRILPANMVLLLALVGQKYGDLEIYRRAYNILAVVPELDSKDKLRLNVLRLKIKTQTGAYETARQLGEEILESATEGELQEIDQYFAVIRRLMVAFSFQGDENKLKTLHYQAKLKLNSADNKNYQSAATYLWYWIGRLHLDANSQEKIDLDFITAELKKIRTAYGTFGLPDRWKTNYEKGALAALFLEATYLLSYGDSQQNQRGYSALYLAHLLNVRLGGNERSEAYGEIVCGIRKPGVKELVTLSMKTDSSAFSHFYEVIQSQASGSLDTIAASLSILNMNPEDRENEIQKLLGKI